MSENSPQLFRKEEKKKNPVGYYVVLVGFFFFFGSVDARKVDVKLLVAFEAHGFVAHTAAHDREADDGCKRSGVHAQRAMERKAKE